MFIYCFLCLFVNVFCVIVKHFGFFGHFASVCSFFVDCCSSLHVAIFPVGSFLFLLLQLVFMAF